MALLVQKFGGSSVADLDKIKYVAAKINQHYQAGNQVIVVVSAMFGETDRLEKLAKQVAKSPNPRELDVLLATGEQMSISLLSMALLELGCPARSYTGNQVHIKTDTTHNKAKILNIDHQKIKQDLDAGQVVVIAGFQGVDEYGNITTLGRGGSDTTAVAVATAVSADECQIYTDVEGVYTADPKLVANARLMSEVTFEEMLELSSLGAKVLQIRSVEFAGRNKLPLRVASSFKDGPGTLISYGDKNMQSRVVAGIAHSTDEARISLRGIPDDPVIAGKILGAISAANIDIDIIVQNISENNSTNLSFTVHNRDFDKCLEIISPLADKLGIKEIQNDQHIGKVSLVGVGMRSNAGIASKMFEVLGDCGVNIQLISTSEIKVSVVLDEKYIEQSVKALHAAFELDKDPEKD